MTDKLTQIEKRYLEVEESLSDADVVSDMERYKALMKEYKELTPITEAFRAYKKCCADLEEAELLLFEWVCCCCSVTKLCLTHCDPVNCSTPGYPVLHYLPEFAQSHVH